MATIFTKIIQGEIPCYRVAEDDRYFAFLDINPLMEGHILVVPKQETDYLFDLEAESVGGIMQFARRIAVAQKKVLGCERVGVAVLGFEVPHAHIHLVPMNAEKDMNFGNPKLRLTPERMAEIAQAIGAAVE